MAMDSFEKGLKIEPNNKDLQSALEKVIQAISDAAEEGDSNNWDFEDKEEQSLILNGSNVLDLNMCHKNDKPEGADRKCGYCKNAKPNPGNCTWGFGTFRLNSDDYQVLMDRGWRRCGQYVYKYDLEKSCCQPYTIRLDVSEFAITKSQKKVLKKFNRFLEVGKS